MRRPTASLRVDQAAIMFLVPLEQGDPVPLDKAIVLFGRNADCDVVLLNSRKVSRKHCCIARIDDRYVIRDLGSMNGIRLNGEVIEREAEIRSGDEVQIGDVSYRLQPSAPSKNQRSRPAARPAPGTLPPKMQLSPQVKANSPPPSAVPGSGKSPPAVDPMLYSMEVPVALPEEGADFIIEQTGLKRRVAPPPVVEPDDEEIIELGMDDVIDDDESG